MALSRSRTSSVGPVLVALVAVLVAGYMVEMAVTGTLAIGGWTVTTRSHADERHGTDLISTAAARAALAAASCPREVWVSPSRGQMLILCPIPGTNLWAGMITTARPRGQQVLEITTLAETYGRWSYIKKRDGYIISVAVK